MTSDSMKLTYTTIIVVILLISLSAMVRIEQFIPNVSPIAAIALLAGATLAAPFSFIVPIIAMVVSDAYIGFYSLPIMESVYGSFVLTVLLGTWLKGTRPAWKIIAATFAASTLFYLITNAAVWKFSGMYPQTLDGLFLSYYYAIPFYRNTLFGDMIYTYSLFLAAQHMPVVLAIMYQYAIRARKHFSGAHEN